MSINQIAIIPARKGSKSIPNKNIINFQGNPLIYWSINVALESKCYDQIIVSSDSDEILDYAVKEMDVVGLKRPNEICGDMARDISYLQHLVSYFDLTNEEISILRPTSPRRKPEVLRECIKVFSTIRSTHDSLRIIRQSKENPYKTWKISNDGSNILVPVVADVPVHEAFNAPRQELPKTYWQTGYLDIVKAEQVKTGRMMGKKIYPYILDDNCLDIDNPEDLK